MAIRNIPLDPLSNYYEAAKKLHDLGFEFKGRKEILVCYDVLTIWADKFEHLGKLSSLDHLSSPDDPPDVRAIFDSGATLDMEHTSVEPWHRHLATKLMGGRGGVIPPVSGKYKTKQEILEATNPWGGGGWASVENEAVANYELIFAAMKKKIEAHPSGGVMVLDRGCHTNDFDLPEAIKIACMNIRGVANSEKWTYCFISRGSHIDFYSTIFSPTIAFEERRPPPPDPTKIKRFFKNEDGTPYDGPWPPESIQS